MGDPWELVHLPQSELNAQDLDSPVLIHALGGYVDAGHGVRIAREHLQSRYGSSVIATYNVDELIDHRARRPTIVFERDHWTDYEPHEITLQRLRDEAGTSFLLLSGPEPDLRWESFVAGTRALIERFGVRLTIGLQAVPMAVPHTRPIQVTAHASREELLTEPIPGVDRVEIPATVGHLLHLRLSQADHDVVGFAAFVPHYLGDIPYPGAAVPLLQAVQRASGLVLNADELIEPGRLTQENIDEQVRADPNTLQVVEALEVQFDAARSHAAASSELPSPDELGAEIEQFLADQPPPAS